MFDWVEVKLVKPFWERTQTEKKVYVSARASSLPAPISFWRWQDETDSGDGRAGLEVALLSSPFFLCVGSQPSHYHTQTILKFLCLSSILVILLFSYAALLLLLLHSPLKMFIKWSIDVWVWPQEENIHNTASQLEQRWKRQCLFGNSVTLNVYIEIIRCFESAEADFEWK